MVLLTAVVVVDCLVQEALVVPLIDPLLSFPSLCTISVFLCLCFLSSFYYVVESYPIPLLTGESPTMICLTLLLLPLLSQIIVSIPLMSVLSMHISKSGLLLNMQDFPTFYC